MSSNRKRPITGRHLPRHPEGFTLIEMMLVMIVMGVLGSMVARGMSSGPYRLDAAARIVRGTLQQAHRTAIQRQYDVVVSFDPASRRIRVFEDANNDLVLANTELVTWRALETGTIFARPTRGIDGAPVPSFASPTATVEGLQSVVFHRDGSTSDATAIYLRDGAAGQKKTMRAVVVTRSTGRVQWYRGDGNRWISGGL